MPRRGNKVIRLIKTYLRMSKEEEKRQKLEELVTAQNELLKKGKIVFCREFTDLEKRDKRKKIVLDLDGTLVSHDVEPEDCILRDGTLKLLEELKTSGIKTIFWTDSRRERAEKIIEKFGLQSHLDVLITRENFRLERYSGREDLLTLGLPLSICNPFLDFHEKYSNNGKYLQFLSYPLIVDDSKMPSMAQEGGFLWLNISFFNPKSGPEANTPIPKNLITEIKRNLGIPTIKTI